MVILNKSRENNDMQLKASNKHKLIGIAFAKKFFIIDPYHLTLSNKKLTSQKIEFLGPTFWGQFKLLGLFNLILFF